MKQVNMPKAELQVVEKNAGVPASLSACHTAEIQGYAVEGHVPADLIRQMVEERPQIRGIGVAGMPAGSPGMDHGEHKVSYNVESFDAQGRTKVYAKR